MRMKWWKVVGLAGVVGVAATGVLVARAERQRRAYTPEEIRDKLRTRHAVAQDGTSPGSRTSGT
ncbi:hypothetical protein ACQP00_36055 [Dactylosporangium sp. CS-047395]|uniref:hypothetical protein n=1 Tax=Dactylosporangium sp. CS-047395 TaxID=3239936 RepID=UPI003D93C795